MTSKESQDSAANGRPKDEPFTGGEQLLTSLFRSLLGAGMSVDSLESMAKRALVAAHRTRDTAAASHRQRQDLDDLAHVLSVWHTHPDYVDRDGEPRPLQRSGHASSFESLTALAIPGSKVELVLEQLIQLDSVSIDGDGLICALRRELLVRTWDDTGFSNWQQSVSRYLNTLEFNYSMPDQARFERSSHSERLPVELLPVFNRWVRDQGTNFVQIVDDWLTRHEPGDADDSNDFVKAGVGVYLFVEDSDKPS